MRRFNAQMEQIQLLIDRVSHRFERGGAENKAICEKLLTLSEQLDYPYGQALAHQHLAHYYQMGRDNENYVFHLERARRIAASKDYFDVLMGYYQLEGIHNAANSNETTALSYYLIGTKLAAEVKDKKREADFSCDIGNLFYGSGAYEDAERFYCRSLELLESCAMQEAAQQRKSVLIGLTHLACARGDLDKAKDYWARCGEIHHTGGCLTLLLQAEEAHILLLEDRGEDAQECAAHLIEEMRRSDIQGRSFKIVYLILMELLLALKDEVGAAWCMECLEAACQQASQNTALRMQKLRMRYMETFGMADDEQYLAFYEATVGGGQSRSQATAEGLKSLIALYETEKERARTARELSDLEVAVNIDELTQIYNRRYLGKLASKLLQDDRVSTVGYVMIDVDYFKEYNDYYGHPKGDDALMAVAALLRAHQSEDAYAGRYGGDEFACLFVNRSEEEIIAFVQAVQASLMERHIAHLKSKTADVLTLTFGICHETAPGSCTEAELIEKADEALYCAKKQGRNTYAVYRERGES